jgi:hypothetical protein
VFSLELIGLSYVNIMQVGLQVSSAELQFDKSACNLIFSLTNFAGFLENFGRWV